MRRRHRDQPHRPLATTGPDAISISIRELVTLVEILEHAHVRISEFSDADKETVASASGSSLIPSLYARAGIAASREHDKIPLLAGEVGLLEAAVINLESYEGNEVVLCAGYQLLDNLASRKGNAYPLCHVHGILAIAGEAGETTSGSTSPSLT
jgi:hypothetical protein